MSGKICLRLWLYNTIMRLKQKSILLLLTIIIFGVLFYSVDFVEAVKTVKQANLIFLICSFFIMCTFPLWCAIRWNIIVKRMGAKLGLWQSFVIIMAAWPVGAITPAKSGDLIKVLFLKNVMPYGKTTGVIIAERMMDLFALSLYGLMGGIYLGNYGISIIAGAILSGVILFFILAASPMMNLIPDKFRQFISEVLEASKQLYLHLGTFIGLLLITLLNWFCSFLQTWFCFKAFHADVPLLYIAASLPIAIFIGLIPITPSGMGTRDSAMIYLFRNAAPYETNLAVGILYSIFGYWLLAIMGIPFLRSALGGSIKNIHGDIMRKEIFKRSE